MKTQDIDEKQLKNFVTAQDLALKAAHATQEKLEVGMNEKDAVALMHDFLKKAGVSQFFHLPFAWFGDRTRFKNFSTPLPFLRKRTWGDLSITKTLTGKLPHLGNEFMPSNKKLEMNMPVILDVAPTVEGAAADIGYSCYFGNNQTFENARQELKNLRQQMPQMIMDNANLKDFYLQVDNWIDAHGFDNCHKIYPLGVLGHKVGMLPLLNFPKVNIRGFHPQAFFFLLKEDFMSLLRPGSKGPYMAADVDFPFSNGLWAIEPHIGIGDMGLKFEEIMVYQDGQAFWLSDHFGSLKSID